MKNKNGQLSLGDAPTVILIVGFTFLVLATMAYIGLKYGNALDEPASGTFTNQTITQPTTTGIYLNASKLKEGACGTITNLVNNSAYSITLNSANYTQTGCLLKNNTDFGALGLNNLKVSYPYTYSLDTVASNVTNDLNTEIANNTSIAGIVLTISLVGIVLSVLIGVFMAARKGGM